MKPILFNTEMVQAIMEGRKTATRRVIKPQCPEYQDREPGCFSRIVPYGSSSFLATHEEHPNMRTMLQSPYCPGDILYVRETWKVQAAHRFEADARIVFKAGGPMTTINFPGGKSQATSREEYDAFISKWMQGDRWHPSIHMPKEAARIFLRVTDVRAERLQELFFAEGCPILELQREGIDIGDQCRECIKTYGLPCCIDDESECGVLDDVRGELSDLWDGTIKPPALGTFGWAANPWVWAILFDRCENPDESGS